MALATQLTGTLLPSKCGLTRSGLEQHSGVDALPRTPIAHSAEKRSFQGACRCRAPSQVEGRSTLRTRCQAASSDSPAPPPETPRKSLLCANCDGNGAVACNQCKGTGLNQEDKFDGRFKAGQTCWLCRGKRQMLCGECNGAGFMGGFMSSQSD